MRIALISLARRGGMVHFHVEIVNALKEIADVAAVTSKAAAPAYPALGVDHFPVDIGSGPLFTLLSALNPISWYRFYKTLRSIDADVYHVVAAHEWNPILGILVKVLRKPLIYTVHDPSHHLGAPLPIRISEALFRKIPDAMVALSTQGREQMIADGLPAGRVFYAPIAVYSEFAKANQSALPQENVMLFFGRIEPYKGLDLLLRAMPAVFASFADWKLIVAGSGDITAYKDQLNHPQIEVLNRYLSDEEIAVLMQRSRFLVLPYIEATQSGVVPIAYAFARPVIVTDVGSLRDMVIHGKTGLLIPPNAVNALQDAIQSLASDLSLCERMGNAAYRLGQEEWGWGKITRSLLDIYSSVLAGFAANK